MKISVVDRKANPRNYSTRFATRPNHSRPFRILPLPLKADWLVTASAFDYMESIQQFIREHYIPPEKLIKPENSTRPERLVYRYRYAYYWRVKTVLPERFKQPCKILARDMMKCVVEFEDGFKTLTLWVYLRRRKYNGQKF